MTRPLVPALCFLALTTVCTDSQPQTAPAADQPISERVDVQTLLKEANSLGSVLFQLAAERFAANERKQQSWILALHDGSTSLDVIKYRDDKTTVVALPVLDPNDEYALRRYVDNYNRFNIKAADLKVKAGQYQEARRIYRLLLHFDPHSSFTNDVRRRLECLKGAETRTKPSDALPGLMQSFSDMAPGFLTHIEDSKAVFVTNLFHVNLR